MRFFNLAGTLIAVVVTLAIAQPVAAQTQRPRMQPATPGTAGDPVWQGWLRLTDGRTFVTDGGLAVDAALAKPRALPSREVPSKVLEDYMKAPHKDEYGFGDLALASTGRTYLSPSKIALNATYVNFLRRVAPRGSRFRMAEDLRPIILVADGRPIAVLMPVKQ